MDQRKEVEILKLSWEEFPRIIDPLTRAMGNIGYRRTAIVGHKSGGVWTYWVMEDECSR